MLREPDAMRRAHIARLIVASVDIAPRKRRDWLISVVCALNYVDPRRKTNDNGRIDIAYSVAVKMDREGLDQDALRTLAYRCNWCVDDLGVDHAASMDAFESFANSALAFGCIEDAIGCSESLLRSRIRVNGMTSPETLSVMELVAVALVSGGRTADGLTRLRQAERIGGRAEFLRGRKFFVDVADNKGDYAGALALIEEVEDVLQTPVDSVDSKEETPVNFEEEDRAVVDGLRLVRAKVLALLGRVPEALDAFYAYSEGSETKNGFLVRAMLTTTRELLAQSRMVEWLAVETAVVDIGTKLGVFDDSLLTVMNAHMVSTLKCGPDSRFKGRCCWA
jgi:hypothetical protein